MRKIIGIGETILDIIFKDEQPTVAVPGGSVFNGIVSLGRLGMNVSMITETGNDRVGNTIKHFMQDNGVDNSCVCVYADGRTAISLAYLNEHNDAEYVFYKDYPKARLDVQWPEIQKDDIIMMGSYFVLNPVLRTKVKEFLDYARSREALIYYDINFRASHIADIPDTIDNIIENCRLSDVVRGSAEDFGYLYGSTDPQEVYEKHIRPLCPNFICTDGGRPAWVFTPDQTLQIPVAPIQTVSTIGAGDNFNAGFLYGIVERELTKTQLHKASDRKSVV